LEEKFKTSIVDFKKIESYLKKKSIVEVVFDSQGEIIE
jgi:hypothetical protein